MTGNPSKQPCLRVIGVLLQHVFTAGKGFRVVRQQNQENRFLDAEFRFIQACQCFSLFQATQRLFVALPSSQQLSTMAPAFRIVGLHREYLFKLIRGGKKTCIFHSFIIREIDIHNAVLQKSFNNGIQFSGTVPCGSPQGTRSRRRQFKSFGLMGIKVQPEVI